MSLPETCPYHQHTTTHDRLSQISNTISQYGFINMAPLGAATQIEAHVSVSPKNSLGAENRDVSTTLNYLKHPGPKGLPPIDSGIPESERRNACRDNITEVHRVVIKDIRGREKDFTWDVQGFQYLQHEIEGVTDWTDRKQIHEIIQPATEKLVKKMCVSLLFISSYANFILQYGCLQDSRIPRQKPLQAQCRRRSNEHHAITITRSPHRRDQSILSIPPEERDSRR